MADPVRFEPDQGAYLRSHAWLAAAGMAGAMLVLWLLGNPHVWTGAPAGLAAVAVRGLYLRSEEMAATWEIGQGTLTGPGPRRVPLDQIAEVKTLGSFVQVITKGGDKHLIKYQAHPQATKTAIERAMP
ncbi:hypothetical protein ACFORG_12935 [Lutimaribacter marinistellae]|uniref:PH domain-containing protein n=1 Tax=Lutimaribacter marinistellae TaxID=1820329 RepID=A0ABV7TGD6_9RHOB